MGTLLIPTIFFCIIIASAISCAYLNFVEAQRVILLLSFQIIYRAGQSLLSLSIFNKLPFNETKRSSVLFLLIAVCPELVFFGSIIIVVHRCFSLFKPFQLLVLRIKFLPVHIFSPHCFTKTFPTTHNRYALISYIK